jgi:PKD repeat protein
MLQTIFTDGDNQVLSDFSPTSSGELLFTHAGFVEGSHTLTLTAVNSCGASSSTTTDFTVACQPSVASFAVTPASPTDTDSLAVTVDEDPTCSDVEYEFAWYVNGVVEAAQTGNALPASRTSPGDEIDVSVTPIGGCTPSASAESGVVIAVP